MNIVRRLGFRKWKLAAYALVVLALATPGIGQNEDQPYFSLSSTRTFAPNGRPSINVGSWKVDSLEFRVYRVNDPIKFFRQIEYAHQFGQGGPRPPKARTFLERMHDWKRGLRSGILRTLRAQFSEPPSSHLSLLSTTSTTASKGTHYAEAPILNPQQMVLKFTKAVHSQHRWDSEAVDIEVKDKGVYLVEAAHEDLRAYTVLMVTDLISITKSGRGRITAFVADRASGQPISGAEVFSLARGNDKREGSTNADGLAEFKTPDVAGQEDLRVLVRRGADVALTSFSSYTVSPEHDRFTGLIYTDRPIYRPGHTVHLKAILRLKAVTGYEIPKAQNVAVQINDAENKPIYQKTLLTSANGTISDDINLSPTASLGEYYIVVTSGESFANGSFAVEEYKKPEYEVRVTPDITRVLEGESVPVTIDARYFFGEPVPGAKVKYSVYRSRYWFPLWYDPDDDTSADNQNGDDYTGDNEQVADSEGQLDQDGKLKINVATTQSDKSFDNRYRIEARVTDEARREISGTGWILATYGSFVINISPNRYFYDPNTPGRFTVQARDYDNKPVQTTVHVELAPWKWRGNNDNAPVTASTNVTTGADGSAVAELNIPPQSGSYRVTIGAQSSGRTVTDSSYVWVAGSGEVDWGGGEEKTVQIVPDKKSYRPGDTAKILIVTGKPNTAVLVAVEGRDLRTQKVIRSQGSTATFEWPITINDEPSLFVTAHFIRNGEIYQSTKKLKVPPEEHKLNIALATDKPQYLPGETGTYKINVTGSDGKPAAHADLSVGVVDEAIYSIRPDTTQDLLRFFFGQEYNSVFTENSLNYFFSGEAGRRRMQLAAIRHGSRLAQLKPERLVQPKIRKVFPDTAFWAANVETDSNGRATVKVPFPDSLTTWRATARGITAGNKVGNTILKTIVRKNLILRLAVPRFFVQGDEVVISAIVHNYLTTDKTARVSLDLTGLDVLDGKTTDIRVPSRAEVRVDWRVRARNVRGASLTGKALTDEESDALQLDLPVNPPGVKLSQSKGGSFPNGRNASFGLTFPDMVEPGSRSMTIRLAPSIAGSLFGALEYLTSFPYGCVEQTMSSFLPNIIVSKTTRELGLKENIDQAKLRDKIQAGLDRLYSFQHDDGGWGWWQTDDTHPFMTAYVVAGLAQARDAGYAINQEALNKGMAWLQNTGVKNTKLTLDLLVYMNYALALAQPNPPPPGLNSLYDRRSGLSAYGLAFLGLALETTKDARAASIVSLLEEGVTQSGEEAWWPATRDPMLDFNGDITPETTAYVVKFLSHEHGNSPLLPKAAAWLMNHRNEGYWWDSTKQTAMVIYGLTDYLKSTNELNPDITATVYVNNQQVLSKQFTSATAGSDATITLDESKLQAGANQVRVVGSGRGRVYYSARAEYFSTAESTHSTGDVALNIQRDYYRLSPTRSGDKIVYDMTQLEGPVSSGDTIAVRLTVAGGSWKYLMVEDPIPAGTEFIERDDLYELRVRPPWWQYWFTRREMHDDRMALFQTYFLPGEKQYFYLLKVVNPGVFNVSPARVQPMYQPTIMATTSSRRLEVK